MNGEAARGPPLCYSRAYARGLLWGWAAAIGGPCAKTHSGGYRVPAPTGGVDGTCELGMGLKDR
jgi:hypothetical protein